MACKVQRDSVEYTDVDNEGLASANIHQTYYKKFLSIKMAPWEIRQLLDHSNYF
jgi:hypothetical protein